MKNAFIKTILLLFIVCSITVAKEKVDKDNNEILGLKYYQEYNYRSDNTKEDKSIEYEINEKVKSRVFKIEIDKKRKIEIKVDDKKNNIDSYMTLYDRYGNNIKYDDNGLKSIEYETIKERYISGYKTKIIRVGRWRQYYQREAYVQNRWVKKYAQIPYLATKAYQRCSRSFSWMGRFSGWVCKPYYYFYTAYYHFYYWVYEAVWQIGYFLRYHYVYENTIVDDLNSPIYKYKNKIITNEIDKLDSKIQIEVEKGIYWIEVGVKDKDKGTLEIKVEDQDTKEAIKLNSIEKTEDIKAVVYDKNNEIKTIIRKEGKYPIEEERYTDILKGVIVKIYETKECSNTIGYIDETNKDINGKCIEIIEENIQGYTNEIYKVRSNIGDIGKVIGEKIEIGAYINEINIAKKLNKSYLLGNLEVEIELIRLRKNNVSTEELYSTRYIVYEKIKASDIIIKKVQIKEEYKIDLKSSFEIENKNTQRVIIDKKEYKKDMIEEYIKLEDIIQSNILEDIRNNKEEIIVTKLEFIFKEKEGNKEILRENIDILGGELSLKVSKEELLNKNEIVIENIKSKDINISILNSVNIQLKEKIVANQDNNGKEINNSYYEIVKDREYTFLIASMNVNIIKIIHSKNVEVNKQKNSFKLIDDNKGYIEIVGLDTEHKYIYKRIDINKNNTNRILTQEIHKNNINRSHVNKQLVLLRSIRMANSKISIKSNFIKEDIRVKRGDLFALDFNISNIFKEHKEYSDASKYNVRNIRIEATENIKNQNLEYFSNPSQRVILINSKNLNSTEEIVVHYLAEKIEEYKDSKKLFGRYSDTLEAFRKRDGSKYDTRYENVRCEEKKVFLSDEIICTRKSIFNISKTIDLEIEAKSEKIVYADNNEEVKELIDSDREFKIRNKIIKIINLENRVVERKITIKHKIENVKLLGLDKKALLGSTCS